MQKVEKLPKPPSQTNYLLQILLDRINGLETVLQEILEKISQIESAHEEMDEETESEEEIQGETKRHKKDDPAFP